jgi:phosphopantothenoylcysteine decarboxylase/phosphopantothenate--cysteine ligase
LGVALADESARRGWPTTLLLGPVTVEPAHIPHECVQRFRTTAELAALLEQAWTNHDVLIMAAAVADYRPAKPLATGKLRRTDQPLSVELTPTPDLLAELATRTRTSQLVIGFALEPSDELQASARRKLERKGVDAIVANPLETMDAETIDGTMYLRDGTVRSPGAPMSKVEFAAWLLDEVEQLRHSCDTSRHSHKGGNPVPRG